MFQINITMEKIALENVTVYSPVEDKSIRTNISTSPIWKKASTEEEYKENPKKHPKWFKYSFKFEGLKPVQFTNMKSL